MLLIHLIFCFSNDKLSDKADVGYLYRVTSTASQKLTLAFGLLTAAQSLKQTFINDILVSVKAGEDHCPFERLVRYKFNHQSYLNHCYHIHLNS